MVKKMNTKKKKGHKHNWQLARYTEPYKLNELILKGCFMFVCECGLSKIVEEK